MDAVAVRAAFIQNIIYSHMLSALQLDQEYINPHNIFTIANLLHGIVAIECSWI